MNVLNKKKKIKYLYSVWLHCSSYIFHSFSQSQTYYSRYVYNNDTLACSLILDPSLIIFIFTLVKKNKTLRTQTTRKVFLPTNSEQSPGWNSTLFHTTHDGIIIVIVIFVQLYLRMHVVRKISCYRFRWPRSIAAVLRRCDPLCE